ncbi:M23 family metallopeptidase [Paractinoplanes atraurantiacus]|uniref:Peptidase family M23 n=1 Tax=Paractinoplanes atraurantiacus TaxID=1036182 RepID=A0A285F105_9ACTN|nr:M23 family metallopeptidase [Actinoplanes atraurantiacus]SNY04076.1 Peptidase family M23 [Actinoplanes atraurantiacus]
MPLFRALSGLTVLAVCLAGCGSVTGSPPATATPQFIEPEVTASASAAAAAPTAADPTAAAPPTPAAPSSGAAATSAAPATTAAGAPKTVKYVFPVKASNVDYHPTHSKYPATDIFADCGEPVVATTSGVVLEISLKDVYVKGSPDGPNNGGLSVSLLGDDGVRYYGSHLSKVQSGITKGVRVTAGQLLGKVGHTGNANGVCHLHYGISPPCAKVGDWKVRRGVIWPATFLDSWRKKGQKSPVATVAAWNRSHNCKA